MMDTSQRVETDDAYSPWGSMSGVSCLQIRAVVSEKLRVSVEHLWEYKRS